MPKQATKIVIGGKHIIEWSFHEMCHTTRGEAWLKCNVLNCGEWLMHLPITVNNRVISPFREFFRIYSIT